MSSSHTLSRWLVEGARRHPGKVAVDDRGVGLTYAELERRSDELAAALARAGYGVGDRVATLSGNSAEHVVLFFACAKAGLALVPLSWRLTAAELGPLLAVTRPALMVAEDELLRLAREAIEQADDPAAVPVTTPGSTGVEATVPTRVLRDAEDWPEQRPALDDDPVLVIFTSGSEAAPKGVVLSHANCFWNSLALAQATGLSEADVVLATLPQFHVAAWNCQPLAAWWHGATVVLERSFEPSRVLRLVADRGVTTTMSVPTQLHLLAAHPAFASTDLGSLRQVLVGGASLPEALHRAWAEHGVEVAHGYGLTEASPNVLYLPPSRAADHPGAVGWPYPYVEVRLVDTDGRVVDGPGTGELQVRGPGVFAGYLHDPERTSAAFDGDWLRTGDLAERAEDGCHRIVDRLKHIYISGGENVAPAEVEAALVQHPLVVDAAVVAVPDEVWGEVGIAFVQPVAGVGLTGDEVLAHLRGRLAGFKLPREVHVLGELPRTGIGKIARADLRRTVDAAAPHRPAPSGTPGSEDQ